MNISKSLNAYLAVSLHLHHSLDKTLSIGILFFLKNSPIFFDCSIPLESRFLCVEQSVRSILSGSPFPGAIECLIKIIFPPFCNSEIIFSSAKIFLEKNTDSKI